MIKKTHRREKKCCAESCRALECPFAAPSSRRPHRNRRVFLPFRYPKWEIPAKAPFRSILLSNAQTRVKSKVCRSDSTHWITGTDCRFGEFPILDISHGSKHPSVPMGPAQRGRGERALQCPAGFGAGNCDCRIGESIVY